MKQEAVVEPSDATSVLGAFQRAASRLLPSLNVRRAYSIDDEKALIVEAASPAGRPITLRVEVRELLVPSRVREWLRQLKRHPGRDVIRIAGTRFLSPRVREICREEGVGYLDLAGNCWLRSGEVYLERVVDHNPFPMRGRPPSLFSMASSRVVRAMLEEPQRGWGVAELARETGISVGQASNVCRRLLDEAYAQRTHRKIWLAQPAKLLEAWAEIYRLADHRQLVYYTFERDHGRLLARVADVGRTQQLRYAVTMFAAAGLVAPFVRGVGLVQWYIESEAALEGWVRALDLRPVESGPNVGLLIPADAGVFYRTRAVNGITLAGNVQLYMDLHNDPARGREQAEFLRKQVLPY